jgi:hypothetical protein
MISARSAKGASMGVDRRSPLPVLAGLLVVSGCASVTFDALPVNAPGASHYLLIDERALRGLGAAQARERLVRKGHRDTANPANVIIGRDYRIVPICNG